MEIIAALFLVILVASFAGLSVYLLMANRVKDKELKREQELSRDYLERAIDSENNATYFRTVLHNQAQRPVVATLTDGQARNLGNAIGLYLASSGKPVM